MKLLRTLFATSVATAASGFAAFAQIAPDPLPPASVHAAANASLALNNGGNPAGALGSASLNSGIVPNNAPLIVGNAGTTGVNGLTGSNAAAASVHGSDVPAIVGGTESIGMRRERFRSLDRATPVSSTASSDALTADVAVGAHLATDSIRSTSIASRNQLGDQLQLNLTAGRRAMAAAEAQARTLDPDTRADFETAARAVASAERRLQTSISAAQSATSHEWARAREALAADYDSYAQAVAHAQRVAAAGSARNSTSLGR